MDSEKFLKDKGLLDEDCKEFRITFQDGRSFDVGDMLNEYAELKSLEFANWLTKYSELAFDNSLWRYDKDVYTNKEMLEIFNQRKPKI